MLLNLHFQVQHPYNDLLLWRTHWAVSEKRDTLPQCSHSKNVYIAGYTYLKFASGASLKTTLPLAKILSTLS